MQIPYNYISWYLIKVCWRNGAPCKLIEQNKVFDLHWHFKIFHFPSKVFVRKELFLRLFFFAIVLLQYELLFLVFPMAVLHVMHSVTVYPYSIKPRLSEQSEIPVNPNRCYFPKLYLNSINFENNVTLSMFCVFKVCFAISFNWTVQFCCDSFSIH